MPTMPLSILDLMPVIEGGTVSDAFRRTADLAQHAERWGYTRYWLAEHHNMVGIASSATAVAIGFVASQTATLKLGAGGVMLPNHAPLVIAEQFGTLATLYPGRIDLGLGRAPGTDRATLRALRRSPSSAETFAEDVLELQGYLDDPRPGQAVCAIPGAGTHVPLWILGSSLYGAQLAAALGLPYAFASHFAPAALREALALYRARFKPSPQLARPYVMVGANVVLAPTDQEARRAFTSVQQSFVRLLRGSRGLLPPPIDDMAGSWTPTEQAQASAMLACSFVGSPQGVQRSMQTFIQETQADELMVAAMLYDHQARLRSHELLGELPLIPAG